jgi:hypothetical protein
MEAYGGIRRGGGEFAVRYAHMNLSSKKRRRIESQGVQSDPNEIGELAGDLPLQILVVDSLVGFGGLLELTRVRDGTDKGVDRPETSCGSRRPLRVLECSRGSARSESSQFPQLRPVTIRARGREKGQVRFGHSPRASAEPPSKSVRSMTSSRPWETSAETIIESTGSLPREACKVSTNLAS